MLNLSEPISLLPFITGSFKVQRPSVLPQCLFSAGFSWIYSAQVCSPGLFEYGGSDGKEADCDMGDAGLIPR